MIILHSNNCIFLNKIQIYFNLKIFVFIINMYKNKMIVIKRNGEKQDVSFDKIIWRLGSLCDMEPKIKNIDHIKISQKVVSQIYSGISTSKLDELSAEICTGNITTHPNFGKLASRIIISNNHKLTSPSFSETIYQMYNNIDKHKKHNPLVSEEIYNLVMNNKQKLNSSINYYRDYDFDYFGFKTLEKAYLIKINDKTIERIQHLFLRVSLGIHKDDISKVLETYDYMSQKYFIHATPTLFHSSTYRPQMLSCFLLGMEDSVDGIYKCLRDCAKISKWAGGIGVWAHDIRAENSVIKSTNGKSNGLVPMLRVFNETARHINQSGKRQGSFAIYLETWHSDIYEFLEAKKNHGDENARARDLFYALWISDLFMQRVRDNGMWALMCPDKCRGLTKIYGEEFNKLYCKYERLDDHVFKRVKAQHLWEKILISQIETGTPYICYKDAANHKTNQQNIGTICSSNLCSEILEFSNHNQYACCTLASIGLPKYVEPYDYNNITEIILFGKESCKFCKYSKNYLNNLNVIYQYLDIEENQKNIEFMYMLKPENTKNTLPQIFVAYGDNTKDYIGGFSELITFFKPKYNFKELYKVAKIITYNLNKVIDINYYPVPETRYSNKLHRPIGIGVQGLADVYSLMRVSFDSPEAHQLNKEIFATIYYGSMEASMEIAKERNIHLEKIIKLRGDFNKHKYTRANEYEKCIDDIFTWKTGDNNKDLFCKEMEKLENEYLPIDEELYIINENDEIISIKNLKYIGSYSSFEGSPLSQGKFQFDLWNQDPILKIDDFILDWESLRENVLKFGVRNSLLIAPMPTASTSQILGNNECIEPLTSNIYSRNTIAGSFVVINQYLLNDLINIGIWSKDIKDEIILNSGSIQNINAIPDKLKSLYKISWDLSQKTLIDQAAERGIYVCQSQSLNLFLKDPDFSKLTSMHFYTWSKGLKTGIYYLRTKAAAKAQQFTIEPEKENTCLSCSA